jgi:hypothetical protein
MTAFGSVTICASPHFLKLSLRFEAIAVVGCAFSPGRQPYRGGPQRNGVAGARRNASDLVMVVHSQYRRHVLDQEIAGSDLTIAAMARDDEMARWAR